MPFASYFIGEHVVRSEIRYKDVTGRHILPSALDIAHEYDVLSTRRRP